MIPPAETFKDSLAQSRQELTDFMRVNPPAIAARELEKSGWSWEWACAAVETVEYKYNPARLTPDARGSQEIREKLQSHAMLGAGLFVIGLVVSIGTLVLALAAGGLIVIAYGAVFCGAGMWLKAYPQLKRYPDRPIPKYVRQRTTGIAIPPIFDFEVPGTSGTGSLQSSDFWYIQNSCQILTI